MGLFSKGNSYEAAAMELEEQQRRRDREKHSAGHRSSTSAAAPKPPSAAQLKPEPAPAPPVEAPKLAYGIEDVIQLMRDLPDSKKEMVILIVQKTLISAKIDIKSILDKAARKIDTLQQKNDKLRAEIRDLEEMIIQKKSDVDRLRRDIEETQQVRQSFETVYLRGSRPAHPLEQDDETVTQRSTINLEQVSG